MLYSQNVKRNDILMEKHMSKVEILIRQFKLSDLDELYKVLSDPEVM